MYEEYEDERAHVAQALVHHQREWVCRKCGSSFTHWHDWKPKTSMEWWSVAMQNAHKLRPHDMTWHRCLSRFHSLAYPTLFNATGELNGTPSFDPAPSEVSLTGALPKDGRATCDPAGCQRLLRRFGQCGTGAVGPRNRTTSAIDPMDVDWDSGSGDPWLFWCTIYFQCDSWWFSLLGRQKERQACLLPRRFNGWAGPGGSPFSAHGFHWVTEHHHKLILCKCQALLPRSEARQKIWHMTHMTNPSDVGYTPVVNLCVRYPTFLPGSFPLTLTFKDRGLSGMVCPDTGDTTPKWPVQCGQW